jgi:DNA-binding NarL/FixJ family response regulator
MMEKIRVLIVDDQVITRSGIRALLAAQEDIEIAGEAQNGEEAVELATSLQPDIILMDLRMPGINGIDATRRIHRALPNISILVLTVFEDDTSVFPALRAGARGYLLKNTGQKELLRAIHTVVEGGAIFSPSIAQKVLGYLNAPPPNLPVQLFDELSLREREILELIAQGKNNAEIATLLVLSQKTVSNNISNILLKVQATDRAKLMLMALEAGMGKTDKT